RTPFSIGSNPDSDLRLATPGVAPVHARIVRLAGAHHLVPGPSSAPLMADGSPVSAGGLLLSHGMLIGLGPGCTVSLRVLIEGVRAADGGDRLLTLMEIARTITSSLALEDVLERVLDGAVRFSGAERGYLFLGEGGQLVRWRRGHDDDGQVEVSL